METDIIPFELRRLLIGEQPVLFYLEIVFRTLLIYGYTLLLVRCIGGRSVGQLSMVEFVLVIALGSAVGDGMFYPDVPILAAMAVITLVVGMNMVLDVVISRFPGIGAVVDGRPVLLVRDGEILPDGLARSRLSRAELHALLRLKDIEHMGQVRMAILEINGGVSVLKNDAATDGAHLFPPDDLLPTAPARR